MTSPIFSNRRGSALLIVLGFLSFMVVSAIAFAVFMRAERAPSSALRRGVATRHLVKAALARAISEVDDAVRNDRFPGLAGSGNNGTFYHDNNQNPIDVWQGRVFMPPDPEGSTQNSDVSTRFAPIGETVSVLNLEGLGYLPPGLVNDVRFLSRCSWAAKWQSFPYDAGRFAYCAVNVSDYFDINNLEANTGRTSADNGRISLAQVFKDSSGKKVDSSAASAFDALVHEQRTTDSGVASTVPYVSMLDYNLALGDKFQKGGFGSGYSSPFWNWINNPSYELFYENLNTNANSAIARAKRQTFVTDSWFPGVVGESTNLFFEAGQPWEKDQKNLMQRSDNVALVDVIGKSTPFKTVMQTQNNYFNLGDWVTLFDYLDRDDLPLSVAQPCVERVPMTAALEPILSYQFKAKVEKIVSKDPANPPPGQGYKQITTTKISFDGNSFPQQAVLQAVFAFPFKRGRNLNGSGFKAQAMMRLALVMSQDASRQVGLRGAGTFANFRPTEAEWSSAKAFELARGGKAAVVTYVSNEKSLSIPTDVKDNEDAFADGGRTTFQLSLKNMNQAVFAQRTETVQMSSAGVAQGDPEVAWAFPDDVRPIESGGLPIPDLAGATYDTYVIRPYLSIWVKVENGDGLVDYVPAMVTDDQEYGGANNVQNSQIDTRLMIGDSAGTPLLRVMDSSAPVQLVTLTQNAQAGGSDFTAPQQAVWEPKSFVAVDPRYNWAPEDWLPRSAQNVDRNAWLDIVEPILGQDGRDPDIFMAVSNQGYLQSMGELAMLPRLTDEGGASFTVNYDGAVRPVDCDWTKMAHANSAWRTYPADYQIDEANRLEDGLFNMGFVADGSGFRVNPYTDNVEVMKAAIEMTPYDWWAAGTNVNSQGNSQSASIKKQILSNAGQAAKYAFCEESDESSAKMAQEDIDFIAAHIMQQIQAQPNKKWEDVFDNLQWYANANNQDQIFGHQLKNNLVLHNVDRKYLHAFWRGCFANKQQLFLIFVRAESNALGGPGEGTPSQKGGRAVALVWRDPNSSGGQDENDGSSTYQAIRHPHRTRVLFYHQFE